MCTHTCMHRTRSRTVVPVHTEWASYNGTRFPWPVTIDTHNDEEIAPGHTRTYVIHGWACSWWEAHVREETRSPIARAHQRAPSTNPYRTPEERVLAKYIRTHERTRAQDGYVVTRREREREKERERGAHISHKLAHRR